MTIGGDAYPPHSTAEAQSEQHVYKTLDSRPAERDPKILARREYEGPGDRQPPETAPERTFGGGRDGGGADNPLQSGGSRGKSRCFGYTIVY